MEEKFPGSLPAQFVPIDPDLWRPSNYQDFLSARRQLIARKLNEYMDSLISEPEETHFRPITELTALGESHVLEFKSTLQWDVVHGQQNNMLRYSSLKTIAAFLNSQGGTLVIGVEDDGNILGLGKDIAVTNNSADKFEQLLMSIIVSNLGAAHTPNIRSRLEEVDDKLVSVIDVDRSPEPVFLKTNKGKEFFIRVGNTTRSLDHEDTHKYIETYW